MNLSVGIVGLPNAGKSTLFNALLGKQMAATAAYPFCTIEPNVGVVEVADERLQKLAEVIKPQEIIPATVKFVDIAGLVKDAHKGEGLGNKFLSHIRDVDLICFVLADFKLADVDLSASQNPKADLEILKTELILKDLETIEKIKKADKETIAKMMRFLNKGLWLKDINFEKKEQEFIRPLNLLTSKPYFIVLNVSQNDLREIEKILKIYSDWRIIPVCAKLEEELLVLSPEEQKEYLETFGLDKSGLERLVKTAYEYLNLISFFTTNKIELRAWTIKRGTPALAAAGVVHTDFEKNFVKARIVSWQDFVKAGSWKALIGKGEARFEARDYEIKDGEMVEFMVGA